MIADKLNTEFSALTRTRLREKTLLAAKATTPHLDSSAASTAPGHFRPSRLHAA
jgi:hypothetical protein